MPRALRHEYPGAVYHVMARGDGGKAIFEGDDDRKAFLFRLGQFCGSHGWRVHAWVLMGNHFHLLLETPEPNLVTGKPPFPRPPVWPPAPLTASTPKANS